MDHMKILAMGVGNMLEWYDFAVFGALADVIGQQFFPAKEKNAALMMSLSVFGAAFVMRPFGGIIMGVIGDTLGRKRALELSILLMIFPSVLIGLLMPYSMWGSSATIMLVILRLTQGMAVGGELVGAFIFTIENTQGQYRGFWGALCIWGTAIGMGVVAILRMVLSEDDLNKWGWRIPFLSTAIVGMLGIWLRSYLSESVDFERIRASQTTHQRSLCSTICNYYQEVILVILVGAFWCAGYYTCFVWMPFYMSSLTGSVALPGVWLLNFIMMLVLVFLLPIAGQTGDLLSTYINDPDGGYRYVMITGCVAMIFCSVPAVILINYGHWWSACMGQLCFAIALACHGGNFPTYMVMMFPVDVRYSGVGLAYNIANALFAGTAPLLQTAITIHESGGHIDVTGHIYNALYLCVVALISLLALTFGTPYVLERRALLETLRLNDLLENSSLGPSDDGYRRKPNLDDSGSGSQDLLATALAGGGGCTPDDADGYRIRKGTSKTSSKKITPMNRIALRLMDPSVSGIPPTDMSLDDEGEEGVDGSSMHSQTPLNVSISGSLGHSLVASTVRSNPNIQVPQMSAFAQSINPMKHTTVVNDSLARQEQRRREGASSVLSMSSSTHSSGSGISRTQGRGTAVNYPTHSSQRPALLNNNNSSINSTAAAFSVHSNTSKMVSFGSMKQQSDALQATTDYNTNFNAIPAARTNNASGIVSSDLSQYGVDSSHFASNYAPSANLTSLSGSRAMGLPRIDNNSMTGQPSGRSVLAQTKAKVNVAFMP